MKRLAILLALLSVSAFAQTQMPKPSMVPLVTVHSPSGQFGCATGYTLWLADFTGKSVWKDDPQWTKSKTVAVNSVRGPHWIYFCIDSSLSAPPKRTK